MMLPVFPILLLIISIASGISYLKTDNDTFGVLAIATAAGCLLWGLVVAHWLILLVSLLVLLKIRTPVLGLVEINK